MTITWIWKPRPGRFKPVSSLNISNDSTWYRAE